MTNKDKKAHERYYAEVELHSKISKLLEEFSLKYDLSLADIEIHRNEFFGKIEGTQPSMYNIHTCWELDYMAK